MRCSLQVGDALWRVTGPELKAEAEFTHSGLHEVPLERTFASAGATIGLELQTPLRAAA